MRETTNGNSVVYLGQPGRVKLLISTVGKVYFNGLDTGAKRGAYAPVTIYYDVPSDRAALDYNHTNVVTWTTVGPGSFTLGRRVVRHRST